MGFPRNSLQIIATKRKLACRPVHRLKIWSNRSKDKRIQRKDAKNAKVRKGKYENTGSEVMLFVGSNLFERGAKRYICNFFISSCD